MIWAGFRLNSWRANKGRQYSESRKEGRNGNQSIINIDRFGKKGGVTIKDIVLARIDERLLHGQVVMTWVADVGCNTIYVIDDSTAKSAMLLNMYSKLAPKNTTCEVLTTQKAIELLSAEPGSNEKIMLLVKIPQVLEALVEAGVVLKKINLGGMGLNKERKPFFENVSASPEEIASMQRMIGKGIAITYQVAPYSKSVEVNKIIEKLKSKKK